MALEIERKFLIKGDYKKDVLSKTRIVQAYLSSIAERTVRVRIRGDQAFLTIKGKGNETATTRYEWEKEIPVNEAEELLKICEPGIIEKTRSLVNIGSHTFEIDEFYGENEGLIIAEIELSHEAESFEKPNWLGEEVTGDTRHFNSALSKFPFSKW